MRRRDEIKRRVRERREGEEEEETTGLIDNDSYLENNIMSESDVSCHSQMIHFQNMGGRCETGKNVLNLEKIGNERKGGLSLRKYDWFPLSHLPLPFVTFLK